MYVNNINNSIYKLKYNYYIKIKILRLLVEFIRYNQFFNFLIDLHFIYKKFYFMVNQYIF